MPIIRCPSMLPVAPHTVSPSTSKKLIARSTFGIPHRSSLYTPCARRSEVDTSKMRSTSAGLGVSTCRAASTPTIGTMNELLTTVRRWSSSPMISTQPGSSAISSFASRSAVVTGSSPGSIRPPGKLTCPAWLRRFELRRVSTTRSSPSSSKSGTSTAEGRSSGASVSAGRGARPVQVGRSARHAPQPHREAQCAGDRG